MTAADNSYVAEVEVIIDGAPVQTVKLPAFERTRRLDLFWIYELPKAEHTFTFRWLNPRDDAKVYVTDVIYYDDMSDKTKN